jgi:hypothetical protein
MEFAAVQTHRAQPESNSSESVSFIFRQLSPGRREGVFWLFQILFWGMVGIIGLLMTEAFRSAVDGKGWAIFIRVATGFTQTAILRWIYCYPWFRRQHGLTQWPVALGCCLALALLEVILLKTSVAAGISFPGGMEGPKLLVVRLFILAIWSSLYFAFHLLENAHAMELRATQAELRARENELRKLQAQMNPHFLLNSLNTVLACKDDPTAVKEVTEGLEEYLRFLLEETEPLEPLSREMDALEKYLVVQATHFGEKMVCRIQCETAARSVSVPPMIVQPLLEDAFLHRGQKSERPQQIWISARIDADFLRVTVYDSMEHAAPRPDTLSSGLLALNHRIQLLLGPEARVEQLVANGWSSVIVHVPVKDQEKLQAHQAPNLLNSPAMKDSPLPEDRER